MQKIIKEVDKEKGIVQITTPDERWYVKDVKNKDTGIPEYSFAPSSTWICEFYPKGLQFYKWLAQKGWDESEAIKEAAGNKGSKVHMAIEKLLLGEEVKMEDKFLNKGTGEEEELSLEEYEAIMSFAEWHAEVKPKSIRTEYTVFNDEHGYAGTIDFVCEIEGKLWIIDFKTSASIWPSYELQISSYKHAYADKVVINNTAFEFDKIQLGILQLGYKRNKYKKYKFTEVEDQFDLFLGARKVWEKENKNVKPQQKDFPLSLQLTMETSVTATGSTENSKPEEK
jgi:hypothetical protein|tara:strand:+ start:1001 stop:1849 length:849 start_codon:yes stop_codon:yes gene_type:complete